MKMKKSRVSKIGRKAMIDIPLKEWIYGIVAIPMIILSVIFFAKMIGLFLEKPQQGTVDSFRDMAKNIDDKILKLGSNQTWSFDQALYIDPELAIIGFNKGTEPTVYSKGVIAGNGAIAKPSVCENDACLCLCTNKGGESEYCKKPIECKKFSGIDNIISIAIDKNYGIELANGAKYYDEQNNPYANLYLALFGKSFGIWIIKAKTGVSRKVQLYTILRFKDRKHIIVTNYGQKIFSESSGSPVAADSANPVNNAGP